MSATVKIWANGVAPSCEDVDLNGFKNENNNLIIGSGQALNTGDNQQTHKAVAHYAGVGDFYVDSGIANAYVLSVTGVQVALPTYATGMRIRFVPGNSNTGASTVNVTGLGVVNLVDDNTGFVLPQNTLVTGSETQAYYDGTDFRVIRARAGRILLAHKTASSSATIDFIDHLDAPYHEYQVEFYGVQPSSVAGILTVAQSGNSGGAWQAAANIRGGITNVQLLDGVIRLFQASTSTAVTTWLAEHRVAGTTYLNSTDRPGGDLAGAVIADSLQFKFDTGLITSGEFFLYGVNHR